MTQRDDSRLKYEEEMNQIISDWQDGGQPLHVLVDTAWDAGWNAGAHHAVMNDWDEDDLAGYIDDREVNDDGSPTEPRTCGATYTTGPRHDPYSTSCDQPVGHYKNGAGTKHEGEDPLDGTARVSWSGGGSAGGDPLPYRDVEHVDETQVDPEMQRTLTGN